MTLASRPQAEQPILPANGAMDAMLADVITEVTPERFRSLCRTEWRSTEHES